MSRVLVTGATGLIGRRLVLALRNRGDSVVALSRDARTARELLGAEVEVSAWVDPERELPASEALAGCDAVINLLGESIAQRWSDPVKERIRTSRVLGTRNLVDAIRSLSVSQRPGVLVSQSAVGYYGARGDEELDESAAPGSDFLAGIVVEWEREAEAARSEGVRVAITRSGIALTPTGGTLANMLPPFKAGIGGPVAGGRQYVPWMHIDDVVGAMLFAIDNDAASGPINLTAPAPVTNRDFSKALGRVLGRPAVVPVPGFAMKLLYGEMAIIILTGQRVVPRRLEELGYSFRQPELEPALRDVLGR